MYEKFESNFIRVIALLLLMLFFFYQVILQISPNVFLGSLVIDFKLNFHTAGMLLSSYFIPYACLQIFMGMLLDKYNLKKIAILMLVILTAGNLLFALTNNYFSLLVARLLMGVGGSASFAAAARYITIFISKRWSNLLMGLTSAIGYLAAVFTGFFLSRLMAYYHWNTVLFDLAICGFALVGLFILFIPNQQTELQTAKLTTKNFQEIIADCKILFRDHNVWRNAIWASLIACPILGFAGLWGPTYLQHVFELTKINAAATNGMFFLGVSLALPIIAWLTRYIFSPRIKMAIPALMSLIIICLLLSGNYSLLTLKVLMFLLGASSSFFITAIIDVQSEYYFIRSTAFSFINLFSLLGGFLVQVLFGIILQVKYNYFPWILSNHAFQYKTAMLLMAVFLSIGFVIAMMYKQKNIVYSENKELNAN